MNALVMPYASFPATNVGLTLSPDALSAITNEFYRMKRTGEYDDELTMSSMVEAYVRNVAEQQVLAALEELRHDPYVSRVVTEADAKAAQYSSAAIAKRIRKARRESRGLPANVARIDAAVSFDPSQV